jgi:hypothetical protein
MLDEKPATHEVQIFGLVLEQDAQYATLQLLIKLHFPAAVKVKPVLQVSQ